MQFIKDVLSPPPNYIIPVSKKELIFLSKEIYVQFYVELIFVRTQLIFCYGCKWTTLLISLMICGCAFSLTFHFVRGSKYHR